MPFWCGAKISAVLDRAERRHGAVTSDLVGDPRPQVRDLCHTLSRLAASGSRLGVNFGLGVEAATARRSRMGAALHSFSLALGGEHINFRPTIQQATDVLTATGWTPQGTRTAPELIRHYLDGTGLPGADIKPTAFVLTATTS